MNRKQRAIICAVTGTAFLFSSVFGGADSVPAFASEQTSKIAVDGNPRVGNPATPGDADAESDGDIDQDFGGESGNILWPRPATPGDASPDGHQKPGQPDDALHETKPEQGLPDDTLPTPIPRPATLAEAAPEEMSSLLSEHRESVYTLCNYSFLYDSEPVLIEPGNGIEMFEKDINPVEVYLDGPDGHLEDSFYVEVDWDFSGVDFDKEGTYPVTGTIDPSLIEYPVEWDSAPPPSFILKIVRRRVLSFQPELSGDTMALHYRMDGEPYTLPHMDMELYESVDNGSNWSNITRTSRVSISDDRLTISGVSRDSLFQAVDLYLENLDYSCSDIVRVTAENGLEAKLISSGGMMGGDAWNESDWDTAPAEDGPYRILGYGISWRNIQPLTALILKGEPDPEHIDFFKSVYVFYGDEGGIWRNSVPLAVEWDRQAIDEIDWNHAADTVIYGRFSEDTIQSTDGLLDFSSMPELTLTISVYEPIPSFIIETREEKLYDNNRVEFLIEDDNRDPLSFSDPSALTVWCSENSGFDWYDITDAPNVSVSADAVSISGLKEEILRKNTGYTFQLDQNIRSDITPFSIGVTVTHSKYLGLNFSQTIDGERGGGKRHSKAPEGLFDGDGPKEPDIPTTPPEPDNPTTPPKPDNRPDGGGSEPGNGEGTVPDGEQSSSGNSGSSHGASGNSSGSSHEPSGNSGESGHAPSGNSEESGYAPSGHSEESGHTLSGHSEENSHSPIAPGDEAHRKYLPDSSPDNAVSCTEPSRTPDITGNTAFAAEPDGIPAAAGTNHSRTAETAEDNRKVPRDLFRAAAGLAAILSGAAIGFYMIRRR